MSEEGKAKAALAYLLDKLVYSDSYGVPGSEFHCCFLCSGGGSPNTPFRHDEECPALKCEGTGEEWWLEHQEEIKEIEAENAKLRKQLGKRTEALEFLLKTKWKSIDRDNMEFEGRVTCFQLDQARAALTDEQGKSDV